MIHIAWLIPALMLGTAFGWFLGRRIGRDLDPAWSGDLARPDVDKIARWEAEGGASARASE